MSQLDFLYNQAQLQEIAADVITKAAQQGATSAQVELSESISTNVEILKQNIENFETSHENQLLLTVFIGNKKGNVGISSIHNKNINSIIEHALAIAKYSQEDPANGLIEKDLLAHDFKHDLELYHPQTIDNQELIQQTRDLEDLALSQDSRISASDGAATTLTKYNFVTANSLGFNHGYQTSRYSKHVSLIGESQNGMQTDYWYSSSRVFNELDNNLTIAKTAAARLCRRLTSAEFNTAKPALIFESTIAKSIIGSLMGALSGNNLYRKLSFLNDSLNTIILPQWLNITEDPFIKKGLASCYFDNECSVVNKRAIIDNGRVNGYLLSSYAARKLGLSSTGNAGGNHNLSVTNNFNGDLAALAKQMGNGIIIIETIGHGLNMVSGDYSVGASGLAVQNGIISHFVDNLTISGNLRDILQNIALINQDYTFSSVNCGSMLINPGVITLSSK